MSQTVTPTRSPRSPLRFEQAENPQAREVLDALFDSSEFFERPSRESWLVPEPAARLDRGF